MNMSTEEIREYLPLLLPLAAVQLALLGYALYHILKHDHYKHGNRAVWLIIVICINLIGPILYLVFGREEE